MINRISFYGLTATMAVSKALSRMENQEAGEGQHLEDEITKLLQSPTAKMAVTQNETRSSMQIFKLSDA